MAPHAQRDIPQEAMQAFLAWMVEVKKRVQVEFRGSFRLAGVCLHSRGGLGSTLPTETSAICSLLSILDNDDAICCRDHRLHMTTRLLDYTIGPLMSQS